MINLLVGVFGKLLQRTFEISSYKTRFFFGVIRVDFSVLLNVRKGNTIFFHQADQVVSELLSSQINLLYGMRQSKPFKHWYSRCHSIP